MKLIVTTLLCGVLASTAALATNPEGKVPEQAKSSEQVDQQNEKIIRGTVVDSNGEPLPGVHIRINGLKVGYISRADGSFEIFTRKPQETLRFSYIGFEERVMTLKAGSRTYIRLQDATGQIGEVVVTGIVTKAKNSYTGAQTTIKKEELLSMGTRNLIESLSAVVPGIAITENLSVGSDPNAKMEFNIRGQSSFEGASNMPIFILDGAEVTYDYVHDMDINDIEAVTVLKDASATALYGAKAAAGVVVLTTKTPAAGRLRLNYNGTYRFSAPDLTEYHLLNASQKLEYERLAGVYSARDLSNQYNLDALYNTRRQIVLSGVDTDWKAKPLRNGFTHSHNVSVDGGDTHARYNIGLRYSNEEGVMIGSSRERMGSTFRFSYNKPNKFNISNTSTVTFVKGVSSPYGSYSDWTRQNPWEIPYDKNGELRKKLSNDQVNPLYEATLGNGTTEESFTFLNTTAVAIWFNQEFRLNADFSISRDKISSRTYISPLSASESKGKTEATRRGSISESSGSSANYSGKLILSYNKYLFNKLFLSATAGSTIEYVTDESVNFSAEGFLSSVLQHPSFATRYPDGQQPGGNDRIATAVGFFANANLMYNNRYFLDLVYRYEGSSRFGRNTRFAPFWSVGAGWNLHNEDFFKSKGFETFKLRGSIGYTGNTSFDPNQAITTYKYTGLSYGKGFGAVPQGIGNPDLKWERTLSSNIGVDLTMLKGRIDLTLDAYVKNTDNLLLDITKAPSVGTTSAKENLGAIENRGFEARARFVPIRAKGWQWSIGFTFASNRSKIKRISNALKLQNEKNMADESAPLPIYVEGESLNTLKVVPSAGIDPATGQEVYIKRDGTYTFVYDPRDKVTFGETLPKGQGSITSYLNYKKWTFNASFSYSFGAVAYNGTLASRVEGSDPNFNADERVFNDRWKQPGDVAQYKNIADRSTPRQTSRFVNTNNYLSLQTLSLAYDFDSKMLKKFGVSRLRLELMGKDIFYLTSIKRERGLNYPFARSVEMSLRFSL